MYEYCDHFDTAMNQSSVNISNGFVFDQRMKKKVNVSAFDIYRQLRIINPSPYMFFFELDDFEVITAISPVHSSIDALFAVVTITIAIINILLSSDCRCIA